MKKTLSLLLAVVMVFTLLPFTAFAAEGDPTITFTTTFNESLTVDDTFKVTATLTNNPGFGSFANVLKWNAEVLEFIGFDTKLNEDDETVLDTAVYPARWTFNNEDATVVFNRNEDATKEGKLYTANFRIKTEEGELKLGLTSTETSEEFAFAHANGDDIIPVLDFSDISGLTVGGKPVGPAIPEGAPFSAVTADQEGEIVIEECDALTLDPYGMGEYGAYSAKHYHLTVPAGTETVSIRYNNGISGFTAQSFVYPEKSIGAVFSSVNHDHDDVMVEFESGMAELQYSEIGEDYAVLVFPIKSFPDDQRNPHAALKSYDEEGYELLYYAVGPCGPESSNSVVSEVFSFEYGEAESDVLTYDISVEQPTGGTVSVTDQNDNEVTKAVEGTTIKLVPEPAEGYRFVKIQINGEDYNLGEKNGCYIMGAEDIVVSAVFELIPPTTYDITVNQAEHGTVSADPAKAAAGDKITLTVTPAEGYELDTLTVKQGETEIEVSNNAFTMPAGAVTVSATFKKVAAGYRFATSADTSGNNGENVKVSVKITGHSDPQITTYNAYDITLNFDSQKLELATDDEGNYIYDGAVKSDGGEIKVDGNMIRIVGVGAPKNFDTQLAELTFKTLKTGVTKVTVGQVQVAESKEAVKDAPVAVPQHKADDTTADETPNESVIEVPYEVQKETYIGGLTKVNHGESYTFWYTETNNYTYSNLTVTVGGTPITAPTANAEGKYVIENVEGDIVISVTRTPNTYNVTFDQNLVNGDSTATYGTPYEFTVTPGDGKEVDSVSIKNNTTNDDIAYTYDSENNKYTIPGGNISGAFTITVEVKDKAPTTTTITFVGDGLTSEEVEGGLQQTATIGQTFTFKLNKDSKYSYTVKIGDFELDQDQNAADTYNIPAEMVVAEGVTVTITKEEIIELKVEVKQYFNVEGKSMFLVLAKDGDKVLSYGEDTMYYSNKYKLDGETEAGAYCWLVLSTEQMNTADQVRTAAEQAIVTAADDVEAVSIKYDYDINSTGKVDINDAQLTYDMYNAHYMSFEKLTMDKFLEADMVSDGKLDTLDVANIVSHIINKK